MGAVLLTLPAAPEKATSCNCSLCRRSGGIWAYYEFGTVSVQGHPGNTEDYIWGDRTLRNVRCKTCGIVTHWEPLEPRRSEEHTSELQSLMRSSYAVFCLQKKNKSFTQLLHQDRTN